MISKHYYNTIHSKILISQTNIQKNLKFATKVDNKFDAQFYT